MAAKVTTRNIFDALFAKWIPHDAPRLHHAYGSIEETGGAAVSTEEMSLTKTTLEVSAASAAPRIEVDEDVHQVDRDTHLQDSAALIEFDGEDTAIAEAMAQGGVGVPLQVEGAHDGEDVDATEGIEAMASTGAGSSGASFLHDGALSAAQQLQRMPVDSPQRHEGICVLDNPKKSFGFISPAIGGPDVYYTHDSIRLHFSRVLDDLLGDKELADALLPIAERRRSLEDRLRLVQLGRAFLVAAERVEFRVTANLQGSSSSHSASSDEQNRRKLRAVDISGPRYGPIRLERALFGVPLHRSLIDTSVVSQRSDKDALLQRFGVLFKPQLIAPEGTTSVDDEDDGLSNGVRYTGWVKTMNADGDRGYIRPSGHCDSDTPPNAAVSGSDAVLTADAAIWDPAVPASQRRFDEGVLVEYTVVCLDRQQKPVATLVTGARGAALNPSLWEVAEHVESRRRRDADDGGGAGGDFDHSRKRGRGGAASDDSYLLLGDDALGGW